MVEWEEPAIVLRTAWYGETSLLADVLTQTQGVRRGLVRGGASRHQQALWQIGTMVVVRWKARLPENLGYFSATLVRPCAVLLLHSALGLGLLSSVCALCVETLPEKESCPDVFVETVRLLSAISISPDHPPVADYVRWECFLLRAIGYGLSLDRCAVTGKKDTLRYVSPRTGRAVSLEGAGEWRDRLLPLPTLLCDGSTETSDEWEDALNVTGYFLERAVFAVHHRPLPAARQRLSALVKAWKDEQRKTGQRPSERG